MIQNYMGAPKPSAKNSWKVFLLIIFHSSLEVLNLFLSTFLVYFRLDVKIKTKKSYGSGTWMDKINK